MKISTANWRKWLYTEKQQVRHHLIKYVLFKIRLPGWRREVFSVNKRLPGPVYALLKPQNPVEVPVPSVSSLACSTSPGRSN